MFDFEALPPLIKNFAAYKMTIQGRSKTTMYNYCMDLCAFFRYVLSQRSNTSNRELSDLREDLTIELAASVQDCDIYSYLLHCATVLKNQANARARKLSSIKAFYKYLTVNVKLVAENPAKDIESPKIPKTLPKYLTLDESVRFLDAVKNHGGTNTLRDTAIFTLFLNCGMRLNELCGLRLSDLTPELDSLVITGKGSKQRVLYLNDACKVALAAYLEHRRGLHCKDADALWVSRNHAPLTDKAVQYSIKKYLLAAGLRHKQLSVHKLRHTAATLLYSTGQVDVRVLKDILGHEQLNTTQIYTHVSSQQVKRAMMANPLSTRKTDDPE